MSKVIVTRKMESEIRSAISDAERAREVFDAAIEEAASRLRAAILPYFQARGLSFTAGNGTWFIDDRRGNRVEDEDLPSLIRDALNYEFEHGSYLGYQVDKISPASGPR